MKDSLLKDAAKTGERVAEGFAASKEAVADAWDDTKHFVRHTRHAVDDLVSDAKHNIKRLPLQSVAVAFVAGALFGLLISRAGRR